MNPNPSIDLENTRRGKSVISIDKVRSRATVEVRSRAVVEMKGKRAALRTREVMDFDPKSRVLYSQKELNEYLVMYIIHL